MTNLDSYSPLRIFWLIAAAIFFVEIAVMLLLPSALSPPVEAALDATVLVSVLFPVLYFLLLRPMVRGVAERERLIAELRETRDQLELRVRERTAELARSVVELEQRNRETALLAELGELLHNCTSVEEACEITRHTAPRLFAGTTGALFGFSPSRDDLECMVTWGDDAADLAKRIPDPGKCWALRRGRSHQNRDLCGGLSCRGAARGARTLCVPMTAQSETLGVLYLQARQEPQSSGAALNERLATTLAEQIGLALANLRLRETLRIQSIVDPLTGLFNRRFMEETLKRELSRAQRRQHGLAVIMLDLDHFKRFNDTFGHDAGDTLLRNLGEFLQSQVRGGDVPCRFGGEEFMLILPEIDQDTARQRAEAIRLGISQLGIVHHGQLLGTATASLGVAIFPQHGTECETLQRNADLALYHAKQAGRDRIVFAEATKISAREETQPARV